MFVCIRSRHTLISYVKAWIEQNWRPYPKFGHNIICILGCTKNIGAAHAACNILLNFIDFLSTHVPCLGWKQVQEKTML